MAKNLSQKPDLIYVSKWGIVVDLSVIVKAKADTPLNIWKIYLSRFSAYNEYRKKYNRCDVVIDTHLKKVERTSGSKLFFNARIVTPKDFSMCFLANSSNKGR